MRPDIMRASLLMACCGLLAACASPRPPGGPPNGRLPAPSLFISPFGEPFSSDAGGRYPSAIWFEQADADASGVIDFEEFVADGRRYFAVLDKDGDQVLDIKEIAAYETALASWRGRMSGPTGGPRGGRPPGGPDARPMRLQDPGGRGGPPGGGPPMGGGRPGAPSANRGPVGYGPIADADIFGRPQAILTADANFDRRITASEWATASERWFVMLDADRNGQLTLAGLPQTKAQQHVRPGK